MRGSFCVDESNAPSTSSSHPRIRPQPTSSRRHSGNNVCRLLARSETCPRAKHASKKLWGECSDQRLDSFELRSESARDTRRNLVSWVEAESLLHVSAKYCRLLPLPRSTIAAAFSSDGKTLVSTHGDHTVKIIDCQTGKCLKVLSGHWRTPWTSLPAIVLMTRRSLRAMHFHPHGASFLLTAEVKRYLHYPPPAVYLADAHHGGCLCLGDELPLLSLPALIWPSFARDVVSIPQQQTDGGVSSSHVQRRLDPSTSVQLSPIEPNGSSPMPEETRTDSFMGDMDNEAPQFAMDNAETAEVQTVERNDSIPPFGDQLCWEVPFLHGWLVGQSQMGCYAMGSLSGVAHENLRAFGETENYSSSPVIPISIGLSRGNERFNLIAFDSVGRNENVALPVASRIQSELATFLAAAAASELPCTVKLRIWPYDAKDPFAPLDAQLCCLTIPHAALCSEMGAHFSPCGRFLAACVACMLPHPEADPGLQGQVLHDNAGAATSLAHQVVFGLVLASRAIRAVYRVSDMELVRVLPSAEDEVKVACFHPSVGGGLVYGTKEGKLRILQYDTSHATNCLDEHMLEVEAVTNVPTYVLEC
ncbi:hypothetical protein P3X46_006366 [Hevea brasiliensis]|uniref:Anaphase-promoting complex subunit 4 WD40 domain-containing protein n=1 Tax=Hevea brasiliensis TaxID=3981 RepID=A0ABQ9MTU1_HEVBR|nr:hypothetical protein P3X46_006366 [Hevea brasiliensis]